MKFFRFTAILLILATLTVFSGCSLNFFSVESLMTPPAQSGRNGEIQKAFNRIMQNKTIQLKAPVSGEYQTAFISKDLDNNGIEEVIVFYSESNTEGAVRIALMECVDDDWFVSVDIKGSGDGIYDVNFVDINNDGVFEVFVSWTLMDRNTTRILSVFEPVKKDDGALNLKSIGNEYGVAKAFVDLNLDGNKDLLILYVDDTGEESKVYFRAFSLSGKRDITKFGEVSLDGSITSASQIVSDVVPDPKGDYTRVFLDCVKNERTIFTEMIYWDNKISEPVRGFANPSSTNARNNQLKSQDIDGDGFIEVPEITTLYGDDRGFSINDDEGFYVVNMIEWTNVKGDSSKQTMKTVFNPKDGYLLEYSWGDTVTVKFDSLREGLIFYEWNNEAEKSGEELFAIYYRDISTDNEIPGDILHESDKGIFYYTITAEGSRNGISVESLKSAFTHIE